MMKVHCPLLQLKVIVNGKYIQEYHKDNQVFVEGRQGSNFELWLKNITGRRLLVHPTVDGLSCMTGEEAARNDHEHGYVLQPYQEMKVPGWRLDNDSVAQFFFAGEGKSYAEKTGRPLNKGVIAAAIWEEKYSGWTWRAKEPMWLINDSSADRFPFSTTTGASVTCGTTTCGITNPHGMTGDDVNAVYAYSDEVKTSANLGGHQSFSALTPKTQNLGTGFGKKADHHVTDTYFITEQDEPNAIAVIYYDDCYGLEKRGIRIRRSQHHQRMPNPFPKSKGCVPPDGWRG